MEKESSGFKQVTMVWTLKGGGGALTQFSVLYGNNWQALFWKPWFFDLKKKKKCVCLYINGVSLYL